MKVTEDAHTLALSQANESRRILSALTGFATLESLEAAEAALKRMPTKAQMLLAIRGALREARQERRDMAIPPMPARAAS